MSDTNSAQVGPHHNENADSRRFKLRLLLLSAADAARSGRRVTEAAGRAGEVGRAIRDRVSMLLRVS